MKKKKIQLFIIIFFSILGGLWIGSFFYFMTGFNYAFHKDIQKNLVEHPEWLPKLEMAKYTSFGFQNVRADWYRLRTIQYIGGNAIKAEYKKYLYKVLELVTGLNPYFEHPYVIGELLLPSFNERYEQIEDDQKQRNLAEAEKIWLLWIKNFCNEEKLNEIKNEFKLLKIWNDPYFKDTCKSYEIPFYLAYINYFYKHDPLTAAFYYKVASSNPDAPEGSKIMAAIMQGKWWDREKAFFMFLTLAKSFEKKLEDCQNFVLGLEDIGVKVKKNELTLNAQIIKNVQEVREKVLWKFNEKEDEEKLSETTCKNYANKAVRELNLMYIEEANEKFKDDHNGLSARNAQGLLEEWYIDFLPTDYQQYKDYGIIYEYNYEINTYDYSMGSYQ